MKRDNPGVCYSTVNETGNLDLGRQKEQGRSTNSLSASQAPVLCGLAEFLLDLGTGIQQQVKRGMLGVLEDLWDPQQMWAVAEERL